MRTRLTVAASMVVAVAFALGSVALVLALGASLRGAAESSAESRAEQIAERLEAQGPDALRAEGERPGGTGDDDGEPDDVAWQIVEGGTVVAVEGVGNWSLPTSSGSTSLDDDPYAVAVEDASFDDRSFTVSAAVSLEERDDAIAALVPLLVVAGPFAVALVGVLTWWLAGRALAPVERIRRRVEGIGARELDQRVPVPATGDEIARLATTMNGMLDRLQTSAERQRRFVADTSHELRSPLAGLRQTAEVARAHPGALPPGELAEAVWEETLRMQHLVDQMLVLTRTGEPGGRAPADVDLDDLLLGEAARVRRQGASIEVDTTDVGPARVHGEATALPRVVRNLVDNAVRHARSRIRLTARTLPADGGPGTTALVEITVADDGDGVPAAERDRIFERFVRLDDARARDAGGSGLGLAIVREVVEAHGGEVAVEQADGGGARFRVRMPAAPA